jgi:hypothetical protein
MVQPMLDQLVSMVGEAFLPAVSTGYTNNEMPLQGIRLCKAQPKPVQTKGKPLYAGVLNGPCAKLVP